MYYGELCIKVKKCGDAGSITFYTRKRKNKVLPETEKVHVGESIQISLEEVETLKTILLDLYAIVTKGTCKKYRSHEGVITWTLNPGIQFEVLTGPVIITFNPKKDHFEMGIECFKENSMETTDLGCIRFTETGDTSLVQKLIAALNILDVTPQDAKAYKYTISEV